MKKEHLFIRIKGAKVHNLKNITVSIPKEKITVFTGVSGSGKSLLVFDTIAVESQRLLNDTYSWFIRNRLPKYEKPDVEAIENLPPSIIINQKRIGGNARSTVGTASDIQPLLRLLFSREGKPSAGPSHYYSFNDPAGMCPTCSGLGKTDTIDVEKLLDKDKSLNEGAIEFPTFTVGGWRWSRYTESGLFDNNKKLKDYNEKEWHNLLYADRLKLTNPGPHYPKNAIYEGLIPRLKRSFLHREAGKFDEKYSGKIQQIVKSETCPDCHGKRVNKRALASKIEGYDIHDFSVMEISDLSKLLRNLKCVQAKTVQEELVKQLHYIEFIGLGYLSLERETPSLSGGESQRLKMIRHLGSSLHNIIYVFDEPSIGLHPYDVEHLNALFTQLRDKGNTVLIVEHDPQIILFADHIVDLGPYAGANGGEIMFEGTPRELLKKETLTAKMLRYERPVKSHPRKPDGWFVIENASLHNLQKVEARIPKGVLTCVTGVAGSGKSTLITDIFAPQEPSAVIVDQSPVTATKRSTPATYLGIMDHIRDLFAQTHRVTSSLFSFNSEGACPACKGKGYLMTDMAFLEPMKSICESCHGKRYRRKSLQYTIRGKSIADIMGMTIKDSLSFFKGEEFTSKLNSLQEVGLDYITLGQSLDTLSGGELQRIKLADELHKTGHIYILDEPTTGLHPADIEKLLSILDRLTDNQNTVIVIEHNTDVMKHADWIIDMGPGAGKNGGKIIFEGTPQELKDCTASLTARYLT